MLFFKGKPGRSGSVKFGDKLGEATVSSIQSIDRRGVFAPMTESGDIFVSEMLSSCFVAPVDISPAIQVAAKAILSPLRLACSSTSFDVCQNESYTVGRPDYVWRIVTFLQFLEGFARFVQFFVLSVILPVVEAFSILVEQILPRKVILASLFASWLPRYTRSKKEDFGKAVVL